MGLLGMVLGEQAIDLAKRHASPLTQGSIERPTSDADERR
jgi:xanthosine utilization system XapX-like protein